MISQSGKDVQMTIGRYCHYRWTPPIKVLIEKEFQINDESEMEPRNEAAIVRGHGQLVLWTPRDTGGFGYCHSDRNLVTAAITSNCIALQRLSRRPKKTDECRVRWDTATKGGRYCRCHRSPQRLACFHDQCKLISL